LGSSADGRVIVTTHSDWTAVLWGTVKQERLATLSGHKGAMTDVTVSPEGETIATVSFDGTAKFWDLRTQHEPATLEGTPFGLHSVALSGDGQRLAVGGAEGSIKLWDTRLKRSVGTLRHQAHVGWVRKLGFLPDGNTLVSVSGEALVVWRAASFSETDRAEPR